jgi:hypothetical protein
MMWWNRLSWRNDRAALLQINVEDWAGVADPPKAKLKAAFPKLKRAADYSREQMTEAEMVPLQFGQSRPRSVVRKARKSSPVSSGSFPTAESQLWRQY